MKKAIALLVFLSNPVITAPGQTAGNLPAPVQLTAQQDHQRMMELLGIKSLRPGPSGNPQAPNAANTDETKATPYTSLPDPLTLKNGKKVTTAKQWWAQRRPEIVEDFDREMYGRMPARLPNVTWEVTSTTREQNGDVPVLVRKLVGHADNAAYPLINVDIELTLTTPANASGPVPVMLSYGFRFPAGARPPASTSAVSATATPPPAPAGPTWQQQLLAKGWGYAIIYPTTYQADNGAGLTQGIIGLVNKGQPRQPDDWGTLRAWAWGASRALDYFETDKTVDARQVGIEGLSRYGKAALVAMAYEPRFAIGFIGSSGEGGAKIHRRHFGEQVENVAGSGEYHWMAGNFIKYAGPLTPNDLPVDAHELVALCAPRPVFISVGSPTIEGQWVDAKGMFLGGVHAGPVYKLLGKKDLGATEFPAMETPLTDGEIAFRQHSGGHTTGPNWPTFLQFADRYIKTPAPKTPAPPPYLTKPLVTHIYTADPSAHVFAGKIYVYPSHDIEAGVKEDDKGSHFAMRDYQVLSMERIGGKVTDHGVALDLANIPWAGRQLWAPDAAYKNGLYYLYFPAKDKQDVFRIGVATSASPSGPFRAEPQPIPGSFSIDPAVFTDTDGRSYLYFGGIWGGQLQKWASGQYDPNGSDTDLGNPNAPALSAKVVRLSNNMLQFDEPVRDVQILDETGKPLLAGDHNRRFFEGGWLHRYNGKYYFSYSTGDTHYLAYAVGDSPYGPFTYKGILMKPVTGWTTHHSIVEVRGKWYIFYHDVELSGKTHLRNVKVTELKRRADGSIDTLTP